MARHQAGETLASIARTYDCSPPAISYVVSKSRTRKPEIASDHPAATPEPQVVKFHEAPAATPVAAAAINNPTAVIPAARPTSPEVIPLAEAGEGARRDEHQAWGNGAARLDATARTPAPGASVVNVQFPPDRPFPARGEHDAGSPGAGSIANGEARRTLHLALGGSAHNGAANGAQHPSQRDSRPAPDAVAVPAPMANGAERHAANPPGFAEGAPQFDLDLRRTKEAAAYIDEALRERVSNDIAAFLAAFDAALAGDTQETRAGLREATDRLLRAGARTRIELERLEARVPLSSRDGGGKPRPDWRSR
jgi:hypothetical protein